MTQRLDITGQNTTQLSQWLRAAYPQSAVAAMAVMPGGASARTYVRVDFSIAPAAWPQRVLLMHWPLERTGTAVDFHPEPFLRVQQLLDKALVNVPQVYAYAPQQRIIALEDLGDETLEERLRKRGAPSFFELYREAVDTLNTMQHAIEATVLHDALDGRTFSRRTIDSELEHFLEWGLLPFTTAVEPLRNTLEPVFMRVAQSVERQTRGFMHRDFQSRNLMCTARGLAIIDFQDAMVGPWTYDLAALLCDSYVTLDEELQIRILEHCEHNHRMPDDLRAHFQESFWLSALQRKLKDAARFVFLDCVRHKPEFLAWYPQSMRYVARALSYLPQFKVLEDIFMRVIPGFPNNIPVPQSINPANST